MKKLFLIFLFLFFFKLNSTNYPGAGTDQPVAIYPSPLVVRGGDKIGIDGYDPDSNPFGLVWLAGGLTVVDDGGGNYISILTPLPLDKEIGLSNAANQFPVLISDLYLSNKVTLTVGGQIETKFGALVLTGEFDLSDQKLISASSWDLLINGNGNILNFSKGGQLEQFNVGGNIKLENVNLKGLTKNSIQIDGSNSLILKNCDLHLQGNFLLNSSVDIYGEVKITGSGFSFCCNRDINIQNGARLYMDVETTFSMGYNTVINTYGNGIIHFNGCNIEIGNNVGTSNENGFKVDSGLIVFENQVRINDDGNHKYFIIGTNSDNKFLVGSRIHLDGTVTFSCLE